MPAIWTVGHSTRQVSELVALLRPQAIELLIDVRTVPRSRRNPQFNRENLPAELDRAGLEYRHEPGLGGLRKPRADSINTGWREPGFRGYADYMQTERFAARLGELQRWAGDCRVVLMCAEALPWRCHRGLIADALLVRGHEVLHILGAGQLRPHRLPPFARVQGSRVHYPGLL